MSQMYRDTEPQRHRGTRGTEAQIHTEAQRHKGMQTPHRGTARHRDTEAKSTETQRHRGTETQRHIAT